jgi:hypothetical protein
VDSIQTRADLEPKIRGAVGARSNSSKNLQLAQQQQQQQQQQQRTPGETR